jgi:hypothetical protein
MAEGDAGTYSRQRIGSRHVHGDRQARIQDFLNCRALTPQMTTATRRGLRNQGGGVLGEEVITPSPPASD